MDNSWKKYSMSKVVSKTKIWIRSNWNTSFNFLQTTGPENFSSKTLKHSAKKQTFLDYTNSSRKQNKGVHSPNCLKKLTIFIMKVDMISVKKKKDYRTVSLMSTNAILRQVSKANNLPVGISRMKNIL